MAPAGNSVQLIGIPLYLLNFHYIFMWFKRFAKIHSESGFPGSKKKENPTMTLSKKILF